MHKNGISDMQDIYNSCKMGVFSNQGMRMI